MDSVHFYWLFCSEGDAVSREIEFLTYLRGLITALSWFSFLLVQVCLGSNGYKPWAFKTPQKKEKAKEKEDCKGEEWKTPVKLPYVRGTTETLQRIFKKHGVATYIKSYNTMRSLLVKLKDKPDPLKKCGVVPVYHISCPKCKEEYMSETGRTLGTRLQEHLDKNSHSSAIQIHAQMMGYLIQDETVKIVGSEDNWSRRKTLEALRYGRGDPD